MGLGYGVMQDEYMAVADLMTPEDVTPAPVIPPPEPQPLAWSSIGDMRKAIQSDPVRMGNLKERIRQFEAQNS